MGRRLSYAELKLKAEIAQKREADKIAARQANPKPYQPRGATQQAIYASYLREDTFYEVSFRIYSANLLISGSGSDTAIPTGSLSQLGLLATPPQNETSVPKPVGCDPAKLVWFEGKDTPDIKVTNWGTRVVSFAAKTGGADGQKNRSCPVGDATGTATFEGVRTAVNTLMTQARKDTILKGKGQMALLPETGNVNIK